MTKKKRPTSKAKPRGAAAESVPQGGEPKTKTAADERHP